MKNGRPGVLPIFALLLLTGCKTESIVVPEGEPVAEEIALTLVAEPLVGHTWETGETIAVFSSSACDNPALFTCTDLDGGNAVFSGICRQGRFLCAVYPADAGLSVSVDGSLCLVDIVVPSEQTAESIRDIYVCATESERLSFAPAMTTVRLVLRASAKDIEVSSVRIVGNAAENLSGAVRVMSYVGGQSLSAVQSSSGSSLPAELSGSWKITRDAPVTLDIPVAPVTLSSGYKVSITQSDGSVSSRTIESPLVCKPGQIAELEEFTFEGPHYYIGYTAAGKVTVAGYESDYDEQSGSGKIYLDEPVLPNNFLNNNTEVTSVTIPSFIESLENMSLRGCANMTRVTFEPGSKCTSFGNQAFQNDAKLEKIVIPAAVKTVGTGCFNACTSLVSVAFEEGSVVETINNNMLAGVQSLAEPLFIPGTLKNLGAAFNTRFQIPLVIHFLSEIPPVMTSTANPFNAAFLDTIYVPSGSLEDYKTATIWSNYASFMVGE